MNPRLSISFSGGATSAVMTKLLLEQKRVTHDIVVTFANTGCEHPATLEFVRDCDFHFNFGTVWLEAVTNLTHGKGVSHKIVSYETASRNGEPFRAAIRKYGIPNQTSPQCTARLKTEAMTSYLRSLGWGPRTFDTAIGIRADEMDRLSPRRHQDRLVYPLSELGWGKNEVAAEVARWPFTLELPGDHYGNCVWCWKKSLRKLLTLAQDDPSIFDFPAQMEAEFGKLKVKSNNSPDGTRRFFREHRSALDIVAMAKAGGFERYSGNYLNHPLLDVGGGCGESCEIGAD